MHSSPSTSKICPRFYSNAIIIKRVNTNIFIIKIISVFLSNGYMFRLSMINHQAKENVWEMSVQSKIIILFADFSSLKYCLIQFQYGACSRHCATSLREGRTFDSQRCHWNFLLSSFQRHYGPGVDSASNRNEYQEYFLGGKVDRCVGLTSVPPSFADFHDIWEPQQPGTHRALPGLNRGCFTFYSFSASIKVEIVVFVCCVLRSHYYCRVRGSVCCCCCSSSLTLSNNSIV